MSMDDVNVDDVEGGEGAPPAAAPEPSGAFASLSDEDKGFVANKGWESEADMLQSYRSLEKLHGVGPDKIVRLPDDPSQMGEVWDRLGRPPEPAAYEVDLPEEFRDGVYDQMSTKAHELGLTQDQWAGMTAAYRELGESLQENAGQEMIDSIANFQAQNPVETQNTRRLLAAVNADEDDIQAALSGDVSALYGLLGKVSSRMGELPAVDPGGQPAGFSGMTPAQAEAKRAELYADPKFMERLRHHDAKVRAGANAELEPLTRAIVESKTAPGSSDLEQLQRENARLKAQMRAGNY